MYEPNPYAVPDRFPFFIAIVVLLSSCSVGKSLQKEVKDSIVFDQAFTGFTLLDPESGKTLADVNGDHFFTPASNTKIFTLYTCLKVLGDSIPGVIWVKDKSFAGFIPIGDPTFLHPKFQAWQQIFNDLKSSSFIHVDNWHEDDVSPLGPGWAWDDADAGYSAERSSFPIYGNVKRIFAVAPDSIDVEPQFWKPKLEKMEGLQYNQEIPVCQFEDNMILYGSYPPFKTGYEQWLPVRNSVKYWVDLLEDTLRRKIIHGGEYERIGGLVLPVRYSCPVDTVYRRMMHQSDNFIAEQLLLVVSGKLSGYYILNQDSVIRWMLNSDFADLPQRPRWVDGSGLSRYNLASPRDFSTILLKLWKEQPRERIFSLFPAGGMNGTVADWYKGKDGKPYVFAKSGSMSGVQCLSGYVLTKKGKVLIFSYMNNNFVGSGKPWKLEMERMLQYIHDRY